PTDRRCLSTQRHRPVITGGREFGPSGRRRSPQCEVSSRSGPPLIAAAAISPFMLMLQEAQQVTYFRNEQIIGSQQFAGVFQADLCPVKQAMSLGQRSDRFG